jgi:hypothetical protein
MYWTVQYEQGIFWLDGFSLYDLFMHGSCAINKTCLRSATGLEPSAVTEGTKSVSNTERKRAQSQQNLNANLTGFFQENDLLKECCCF